MAKTTTKDMTSGSPMRLILGFAVPMLMGMLFQQVYNLVDTLIVGKYLGVEALAAVGSTGNVSFLILGFCMGVCGGFTLPVAQRFGAKDYDGLRKYVGNSAVLSAGLSIITAIVTVLMCHSILVWMNTPEDIIQMAYEYIVVIFAGIPFLVLYNTLSGYIRALGDSITPVIYLVISALLNIVLDLLFILSFDMGVMGAALATIISQGISGILCLIHIIYKFEILHISRDDLRLERGYVRSLIVMGLPMGLQYSITAIGGVILQAFVNPLGSTAVAAMTAAGRISGIFVCPYDALGSTMATYGGQNVGAGRLERLKKGLTSAVSIGAVYSVIAFLLLWFFGKGLLAFFIETEDPAMLRTILDLGYENLIICAAFYFTLALVNIVRFYIQGMGFSGFAVFAGVFEMIARAVVGMVFVPVFGFTAACFAGPVAWIMADMFLIPAYFSCYKKLQRMLGKS